MATKVEFELSPESLEKIKETVLQAMEEKEPSFMRFKEFCDFCGITESAGRGILHQGNGPKFYKRGKYLFFKRGDIEAWILSGNAETHTDGNS